MSERTAASYADRIMARAPGVLRFAFQVIGDADTALAVTCDVLSRRRRRRSASGADDDERVLRDVVRAVTRRPGRLDAGSPFARLTMRQRVATVLAFGQGWDPNGVAEVMGTTPRRARVAVRAALAVGAEADWRRLLADPRWSLEPPGDIVERCHAAARRRRALRERQLLAAAAVTTAVAGSVVAAARIVTAPAPLPPTAHVAGLLPWPARGELARDHGLTAAAIALWRQARASAPVGDVYVLYAGQVGVGRLVVLQALGDDGTGRVAVVGDHDVTFNHPRLRLDVVAPLARTDVPVLAIPYNGNITIAGLTAGPGSRVEQLLVAPDVDRVDHRDVLGPVEGGALADFSSDVLARGLSDPWLDLTGERPSTVVRAYRDDRLVFTGLLTARGVQPVAVHPHIGEVSARWPTGGTGIDGDTLAGDALWWAQYCRRPGPVVAPAWLDPTPRLAPPLRLELARCAPAAGVTAQFLEGAGSVRSVVGTAAGSADAYVAVLRPTQASDVSTVIVVGNPRVARIRIGRAIVVRGRVANVTVRGDVRVRVFDAAGHRLVAR